MEYEIIRTNRRSIAIQITREGRVLVRAPLHTATGKIQAFVESKAPWIRKHLALQNQAGTLPAFTQEELHALANQAKALVPEQTAFWARKLGVTYGRITIRAQRTRWGSCSGKGNLNFNCLLMLVPDEVRDYVIVHELCHRLEMNHSPRFWALVENALPDYKIRRKWLKTHGRDLIRRII